MDTTNGTSDMVQKYSAPARVYKYQFELVMAVICCSLMPIFLLIVLIVAFTLQAYECRFPICDMIPILVDTEIIREEEAADGTLHMVERRCKVKVDAPYLMRKVIAALDVFIECLF